MDFFENSLIDGLIEYNEQTASKRIGSRIRQIRTAKGMSQGELGEKVGLTADRIQKYENGARKPKLDMLKKIAVALGVEPLALTDPVNNTEIGVMYTLFELEEKYGLTVDLIDKGYCLILADNRSENIPEYLKEWYRVKTGATDEQGVERYNDWKWRFPKALMEETSEQVRELRKMKLQEQIERLQQELTGLEGK